MADQMSEMNVENKAALIDILLESSSSSDDEDLFYVMKQLRKKPKVKNFIQDVITQYSNDEFRKHLRISRRTCHELIRLYEDSNYVSKDKSHGGKEKISPEKQILSFLWFAGNQAVIRNVAELFDMSESTFHEIITKVINFLVDLAPQIIKFPSTDVELLEAADKFERIANFPNVVGCIDGSYINVRTPANKIKSTYVNRHDLTSLTLQGICDADRKFIDVFTGVPGKLHDSRVFSLSFIKDKIQALPDEFHLLGDAAYPISRYLLTPYRDYGNLTANKINYNQKFSATRVLIENAFGLLKGRFRQLLLISFHSVERCSKFIIACCVLHNLCISNEDFIDIDNNNDNDNNICCNVNDRNREEGERKRDTICNLLS